MYNIHSLIPAKFRVIMVEEIRQHRSHNGNVDNSIASSQANLKTLGDTASVEITVRWSYDLPWYEGWGDLRMRDPPCWNTLNITFKHELNSHLTTRLQRLSGWNVSHKTERKRSGVRTDGHDFWNMQGNTLGQNVTKVCEVTYQVATRRMEAVVEKNGVNCQMHRLVQSRTSRIPGMIHRFPLTIAALRLDHILWTKSKGSTHNDKCGGSRTSPPQMSLYTVKSSASVHKVMGIVKLTTTHTRCYSMYEYKQQSSK